jgi:lipopolysaccharide transport system ATP-binding protein
MAVIRVENISKKYQLGHQRRELYRNLRDVAAEKMGSLGRFFSGKGSTPTASTPTSSEEFWALRDVSFSITQGERVGIIGRNGAGKSTLLKILSRITPPTLGRVLLKGQVASLLEVGTGFHPELTGRENIFLNGAILGMSRVDIKKRFDEIVAFAEIEQFIDTPVKRYSSGMYVRLAFAVAAHLEPEILIVDEVLAVGDAQFQNKCLGKMQEVGNDGRTVVFVSHNMGAVKQLCNRALLFSRGEMTNDDLTSRVVDDYLHTATTSTDSWYSCTKAPNEQAWLESVVMKSDKNQQADVFFMSEEICVECILKIDQPLAKKLTLSVQISELNEAAIYHFPNGDALFDLPDSIGKHRITVRMPPLNLYPERYKLRLNLCEKDGHLFKVLHEVDNLVFRIEQDYALVRRKLPRQAGLIYLCPEWSHAKIESASI